MITETNHVRTPVNLPVYTHQVKTPDGTAVVEFTPFNKADCKLLHDAVDEMLVILYRKRMRLEETMCFLQRTQSVDTLQKRQAEHAELERKIKIYTQLSTQLINE